MLESCPPDWSQHLVNCGGGYFHTPMGLRAGAPPGAILCMQLRREGQVLGLALGIGRRCRLSHALHAYFPSLPALHPSLNRLEALDGLAALLRRQGAADATFDSFDARWIPPERRQGLPGAPRQEYVVPLSGNAEQLLAACAANHRRHVNRGTRNQFQLRQLSGADARSLLGTVAEGAADRAAARGVPFAASLPPAAGVANDLTEAWGAATFSAWRGDEPLAAALIGWGNRHAFYVLGGSTEAGYECAASVWLHWSIMRLLAEHRFTFYNLGGTPAGAQDSHHPAHGLFRFKTGFGAQIWRCRGIRWVFRPNHRRAHQLARWLAARTFRGTPTNGHAA